MEQQTQRTMAIVLWLLLLWFVSGALQARAQLDNNDFISIDCGLPGQTGYTDSTTMLPYATDAGFIDAEAGVNRNISDQYISSAIPTSWHSVRSFPSGRRNCYTLPSLVSGLKYLIRGTFLYGNYDGPNNSLPVFDLYIGVNFWTTVTISASDAAVYTEAITVVPDDFVQVCLMNTGGGTPFISGLDLRPLATELYPLANNNATQVLVLLHRLNFAPKDGRTIRHPDDPYDRIWSPVVGVTEWAENSTESNIKGDVGDRFQPPQAVMQTAVTRRHVSENIEFTLGLDSFPSGRPSLGYAHTLYFCELQQVATNALRKYHFYRNGELRHSNYTPSYLEDDYVYSDEPFQANQCKVSLNATADSTLPPIINAIELFAVVPTTILATDSQDVSAAMAIKGTYQVHKNWMGDPCIPKDLRWDGLTCSYDVSKPPIITNV